jgi:hypothetical protein
MRLKSKNDTFSNQQSNCAAHARIIFQNFSHKIRATMF